MTFPLLDGMRAVAALAVFAHHVYRERPAPGPLAAIADHGNAGVLLFFLISGFLLYRPLVVKRRAGRDVAIGDFYRRRALRIIPAYWVALTVLAIWPGLPRFSDRWWQLYLFGQGFDPATVTAGIAPAWSLAVEVSFYLLLPLYALAVTRLRIGWVAELAVLAVLAVGSMGFHVLVPDFGYTLPGTFYLFAVGMWVAILSVHTSLFTVLPRLIHPAVLGAMGVVGFVALALLVPTEALGSAHPLYIPIAALLLLAAVLPGPRRSVLGWAPLAALGVVSYAFYLWHQTVVQVLADTTLPTWAVAGAALVVVTAIAAASWRLVEKPVLRLARRH